MKKRKKTEKIWPYRKNVRWFSILTLTLLIIILNHSIGCAASDDKSIKNLNSNGTENRALSVDPTGKKEGFSAVIYDNMNGLPTSEANAIAGTSDGFLWIGSYAGLIRYDGNTFERLDSTNGLTSIKCLYVDSRERLWIGTNDNGVAVMERGEFRIWGKLDGMKSAHTRAITEDKHGNIYVATTCGIMMFDQDENLTSLDAPDIAEADMRSICTGNDGTIYGTTNLGDFMVIRDGKLEKFVSIADSPLNGVGTIFPDPEEPGVLYQESTDFGLYKVDLNSGYTVLEKIDIGVLKYIMCMEYIDGKVWICAGNGIGVLEDDKFQLLENLPMNSNIGHVMTDYLGNLWFTSTRQGVMKVVPNQFSDLFQRFNLPEMVVNSTGVCDGKLFVGTDTGLLVLDENGPLSKLPLKKAVTASGKAVEADDLIQFLTDCRIRSVIRDSKERLWISTWRASGLLRYDHGELTVFTEEDGILSTSLRAVCEREDGTFLVAVTGGVNIIKEDRVIASYSQEDGIDDTESLTVLDGTNGDIILGSNGGGIYIIGESGVKKTINVEDGLSSDIVMRLKKDEKRNLIWIVTSNSIAYMTSDYQVTTIKKFPYPNNFDLFETSTGDMWVLGSNGIYVVPVDELLANGELNPVFYGSVNGLPCITTANSFSELTADGVLYIAGSTGVCKVNIEKPYEDVSELKVFVPYVEADGVRCYPDKSETITIPSDTQKLTVYGYVFNYALSDPKVSYKLEGFDRQSTTINRSEMIPFDYTNLSGGTYTFVMQLKDSMGRGNKAISVRIVKVKAFYEQTWFFVVSVLLVLVLLAFLVQLYVRRRMRTLERKNKEAREQFEQTAEALASAIDAKDNYTNGHSRRVAEYSMKIAGAAGMSAEECDKVYFVALLHDVGKIGVPIEILAKKGKLTDEEFECIKQHPVIGGQILSSIRNSPWLSIGARYHHERYNGKGYPEGLKGEDIPEIARIIAVADAYDAMTSNRSYRNAIPQHIVREELVKGIGTQFDPKFARIMIQMMDQDREYRMRETKNDTDIFAVESLRCDTLYHDCTKGIAVTNHTTKIRLCSQPDDGISVEESLPTLIVFDSLDGKVHPGEEKNRNVRYIEFAQIRFDGYVKGEISEKIDVQVLEQETILEPARPGEPEQGQRYLVESVREEDQMMVQIADENKMIQVIIALPDTSHIYLSISGEHCCIHNILCE